MNNKIYYGSSNNCNHRWNQHRSLLNKNKHKNQHLQNSWNLYGSSSFKFNIVKNLSIDLLKETEQQYLDIVKLTPNMFYNIGYDSHCPTRGLAMSQEHKDKISHANKGKLKPTRSKEHRENISKSILGKLKSNEHKKNISIARKGIKFSIKHCKNLSKSLKGHKPTMLDKTVYSFKNKITNEIFTGIRCDFIKKYNLNKGNINTLIKRKSKSCKNWITL